MNKGYSFFAGNHWYIMQTEKTKVSQSMIKQFVKAHADRTGCSDSWFVKEILASTKELADVRKRIDTCVFEERECVIDLDGKPKQDTISKQATWADLTTLEITSRSQLHLLRRKMYETTHKTA